MSIYYYSNNTTAATATANFTMTSPTITVTSGSTVITQYNRGFEGFYNNYYNAPSYAPRPLTPAQLRDRERERQREREAWAARRREEGEAATRAHALLMEMLTPEQQASWGLTHEIAVEGEHSKQQYRLTTRRAGGVYRMNASGRRDMSYCIHHANEIPIEDQVLAQKLLLETDEREFLRIANATRIR